MVVDADGKPDDTGGADVTLVLPLGIPDGVVWDEIVGNPDGLEPVNPAGELLLALMVESPDGADPVGKLVDELFNVLEKKTEGPVEALGESPDVGVVELIGPIETTDKEPEMIGTMAVLLGNNETLMLDDATTLDAGTVGAFTCEAGTVTVVVVTTNSVLEMVPSI